MGTSKTPMQPATSVRASTSMAVHPSVGASTTGVPPLFTKYAKIQPAIAIKPKPQALSPVVKSTFNPRYDPSASSLTLLHEEAINTLRKWILPPRPRPGRKPSSQPVPEERKTVCKKKIKTRPATSPNIVSPGATPVSGVAGCSQGASILGAPQLPAVVSNESIAGPVSPTSATAPLMAKTSSSVKPPTPGTATSVVSSRLEGDDLRQTFLARLKEQELIRNYIEVLTNQIKELRFVQNGVITVDALDSSSSGGRTIAVPQTVEQLDQINNIRDLDRFVAHLTTQLNVIHSVTKKISASAGMQVQLQIRHYLDLREKHRGTAERTGGGGGDLLPDHSSVQLLLPPVTAASTSFTPSLLRPLQLNSFGEEDVIDVEILKDDSLLDDGDKFERLNKDDGAENSILGDLTIAKLTEETTYQSDPQSKPQELVALKKARSHQDTKETQNMSGKQELRLDSLGLSKENVFLFAQDILVDRIKVEEAEFAPMSELKDRRRKMVCGFCNTEAPCLCFDADSIFGQQ